MLRPPSAATPSATACAVLAAAEAVFAERGLEAGVPEVADRAGVGKATVYRSFPTKEQLVAAVAVACGWRTSSGACARARRPDAWQALHDLLADSAERQCGDRAISAALASGVAQEQLAAARSSLWAAVDALLDRAKAEGRIAPDARPPTCASCGRASRACWPPTATATRRLAPLRRAPCCARSPPDPRGASTASIIAGVSFPVNGVLLAGVEAAEHVNAAGLGLRAVAEPRDAAAAPGRAAAGRVPPERAERHDHADVVEQRPLRLQPARASVALRRQRLVRGGAQRTAAVIHTSVSSRPSPRATDTAWLAIPARCSAA